MRLFYTMIRSDLPLHRYWRLDPYPGWLRRELRSPGFGLEQDWALTDMAQVRAISPYVSVKHHLILAQTSHFPPEPRGKRTKVRRRNVERGSRGCRR